MTNEEAMQMALETLDNMVKVDWREWDEFASVEDFVRWAKSRASFTAEALRVRLAQPEPAECDGGQCGIGGYCKQCPKTQPETVGINEVILNSIHDSLEIVAAPQKKWVGLTDEETEQIVDAYWNDPAMFIDAIEAKLKEKNT